jgi:prevent-host-death family protein
LYNSYSSSMAKHVQSAVVVTTHPPQPDELADFHIRRLNIAEARESLTEVVSTAYGGNRAIVMRRGKEVAAIVPMADLDAINAIKRASVRVEVMQTPAVYTFTIQYPAEQEPSSGGKDT